MGKEHPQVQIRQEAEARRFVALLDGEPAVLEYEPRSGRRWDLLRTYVPEEHRRRGIATQLVRHALDVAAADGRTVIPSCWFVAEFIDEHPRYQTLVVTEVP